MGFTPGLTRIEAHLRRGLTIAKSTPLHVTLQESETVDVDPLQYAQEQAALLVGLSRLKHSADHSTNDAGSSTRRRCNSRQASRGKIYHGETGSLLVSLVGAMPRLSGRRNPDVFVRVNTADIAGVTQAVLHRPGHASEPLALGRETRGVQSSPPADVVAGVVELEF